MKRPDHRLAAVVYLGGLGSFSLYALDEWLDLRKWKRVSHYVHHSHAEFPVRLNLRARTRPPPIGAMDWPAGRCLLHWAIREGVPLQGATVLEIGSGIGTTAIGLALAASRFGKSGTHVIATDSDEAALNVLRSNADDHGLLCGRALGLGSSSPSDNLYLSIAQWDARSINVLPAEVKLQEITHVIAADVVYHGGADGDGSEGDDGNSGSLANSLSLMLKQQPRLSITLLLVDRFSGGSVSALASAAGVKHESCAFDPALVNFERRCAERGLRVRRRELSEEVVCSVAASLSPLTRAWWNFCGVWDGLWLYEIDREPTFLARLSDSQECEPVT